MAILVEILLAFALLLQSLEYLGMKDEFRVGGTWAGPDVALNSLFNFHLYLRLFLLVFILLVGVARYFDLAFETYRFISLLPVAWLGMLASQLILVLRMNLLPSGGAEALLFWFQISVLWMHYFGEAGGGLIFVAVLLLSSYFLAGLRKLWRPEWRSGEVLRGYLKKSWYRIPANLREHGDGSQGSMRVLSRAIVLAQIALPLVLLLPGGFWGFVLISLVFHLLNFWVFSLNRFVWVWAAGYPAVYALYLKLH